MLDPLKWKNALLGELPVLSRDTSPNWACAIGFILGGIGLAIYFRSFVDLVLPVAVAILASIVIYKVAGENAGLGWFGGAILASVYGYYRSLDSNKRRVQPTPPTQNVTGPVVDASD